MCGGSYLQRASTRPPSRSQCLPGILRFLGPSAAAARTQPRKSAHRNMPCHVCKIRRCPDSADCRLAQVAVLSKPSVTLQPQGATEASSAVPCMGNSSSPVGRRRCSKKKERLSSVSPLAYVRRRGSVGNVLLTVGLKERICGLTSARVSQAHREGRDTSRHRQIEDCEVQHAHQSVTPEDQALPANQRAYRAP
ncbi:uncharacterized protein B0H64DRAFT_397862 [Chaetomium fimeti]|uniref:Uncharacterized protein n=1 Tax=Chaetomium fimeti TaxID=1854472 RepID=A0AAE0HH14_9PEZI|nr:hypothetical protein B0H64DRAFT_397862 [Chaetomium fimeti]